MTQGPALCRHERLRLSRLGAALLRRRAPGRTDLLRAYADRLPAVELNNTFYQQPKPDKVAAWLAATPADFRFVVKAQRGGSMRAFGMAAAADGRVADRAVSGCSGSAWAAVLYRVPDSPPRRHEAAVAAGRVAGRHAADGRVQHASWQATRSSTCCAAHGAALCATDLDERRCARPAPDRPIIYLRLRRTTYTEADLADWAARLRASLTPASIATSSFATTRKACRHFAPRNCCSSCSRSARDESVGGLLPCPDPSFRPSLRPIPRQVPRASDWIQVSAAARLHLARW